MRYFIVFYTGLYRDGSTFIGNCTVEATVFIENNMFVKQQKELNPNLVIVVINGIQEITEIEYTVWKQ